MTGTKATSFQRVCQNLVAYLSVMLTSRVGTLILYNVW